MSLGSHVKAGSGRLWHIYIIIPRQHSQITVFRWLFLLLTKTFGLPRSERFPWKHTPMRDTTSIPSWYIRHLAAAALLCRMESLAQSLPVLFSFLSFRLLMNLDSLHSWVNLYLWKPGSPVSPQASQGPSTQSLPLISLSPRCARYLGGFQKQRDHIPLQRDLQTPNSSSENI